MPRFDRRNAEQKQTDRDIPFRLAYLDVEVTDSDVRGGEPVYAGDVCVGVTTSGAYGHHVGRSLAFAYVGEEHAIPGTQLGIDLLGERCMATILSEPVYDPGNLRLKG